MQIWKFNPKMGFLQIIDLEDANLEISSKNGFFERHAGVTYRNIDTTAPTTWRAISYLANEHTPGLIGEALPGLRAHTNPSAIFVNRNLLNCSSGFNYQSQDLH